MIMRCTSPLFPFFTTLFILGFHQRTAGFLFSQCEGIYPSFRPAKASEVPGAHKSHWLFVTPLPAWNPKFKLPSSSSKRCKYHPAFLHLFFFTSPCIVLVAVSPNHWLDLTDSIRFFSLCFSPLSRPLFSSSLSPALLSRSAGVAFYSPFSRLLSPLSQSFSLVLSIFPLSPFYPVLSLLSPLSQILGLVSPPRHLSAFSLARLISRSSLSP